MKYCSLLLLIAISTPAFAGPPDESLLSKVPAGANTLFVYDVEGAYQSPLGKRENWVKRFSEVHVATLDSLPPTMKQLVIASKTNFATLEPDWQVGVAKTMTPWMLSDVAKSELGQLGQVAGQTAVLSSRNSYITIVGTNEVGVYHPADRRALSNWLKDVQSKKTTGPAAYARAAIAAAAGAQLIAAVDLEHVIDPIHAKLFLSGSPTVQKNRLNVDVLTKVLAGVKGCSLTIRVTDKLEGRLTVDFEGGVMTNKDHLPALIDEVLAAGGIAFDEVRAWPTTATESTLTFQGPLESASFHRLLCFFDMPAFYVGEADRKADSPSDAPAPLVTSTLRYFNSVSAAIAELKSIKPRDDDYNRYATWYEKYAKKLDALPNADVDPDALKFGIMTANRMRAIAESLRGVPLKVDDLSKQQYTVVGGYVSTNRWGRNTGGSIDVNTNAPEIRQKQVLAVQSDRDARDAAWKAIYDDREAIRAALAARYRVPVK